MSDRRPPEDPWSEVLDQVEDALVEAGIGAEPERGALLDGVRSALDSLVGLDTSQDIGPEVVVVEGGRGEHEPPTEGAVPPLRVADPPAAEGPQQEDDGRDASDETSTVWSAASEEPWTDDWSESPANWGSGPRVVVRVPSSEVGGPFPALTGQGRFELKSGDVAQTVFVGPVPRTYRVACAIGGVLVCVDGGLEVCVRAGCSVDVEARQVTVRADGHDDARGRYVRLDPEHV